MIKRTPSSSNPSIVNSAHEEHFNVVKSIRDNAPVVDMSSVVKSINFESDGDGAYILRKPLVKKESLQETPTLASDKQEAYLYDKEHKLIIENGSLTITNATKVILKCYDNDGIERTIEMNSNIIPNFSSWATVNKIFNTVDHTLLSCKINHPQFLDCYVTKIWRRVAIGHGRYIRFPIKYEWYLTNATPYYYDDDTDSNLYKTLHDLNRFISIYESVDEPGVFIVEIIHAELNSITSGLDVGNPNTLDINLLLDNPYAIRDLYNYGYWSTTKILPYVVKDESVYSSVEDITNNVLSSKIWELTESDFIPASEDAYNPPDSKFRLLISTSSTSFDKQVLILKAFITTTATPIDLYCCWEESKNNGIDWDVCEEFIDKFSLSDEDEHLVSDLTSKEFTETLHKESLTNAQSYLVSKKLYHLPHENYHQDDLISDRPDVLIIKNPDLSKLYRFVIYIDSNQTTPTAEPTQHTAIKAQFNDISGNIDEDGNVKYEVVDGDEDSIENQRIVLQAGDIETVEGKTLPDVTVGNALHIYTENPLCQLTSITYSLAPSRTELGVLYDAGSFIGITNEIPENFNIPDSKESSAETSDSYTNMFGIKYDITYDMSTIESLTCDFDTAYNNSWKAASSTKTILLKDGLSKTSVHLFNISNCLYDITTSRVYEGLFRTGKYVTFSPHANGWNINTSVTYNGKTVSTSSSISGGTWYQDTVVIQIVNDHTFTVARYRYITNNLNSTSYTRTTLQEPETTSYVEIGNAYGYQVTNSIPARTAGDGASEGEYGYHHDTTTFPGTIVVDDSYRLEPTVSTAEIYRSLRTKGYNVTNETQIVTKIQSITVTYTLQSDEKFTSIYLVSTTGNFQVAHSQNTEYPKDLTAERNRIFSKDSQFYYNENQAQLLVYNNNFVYSSGTNSAIMKLMDSLTLPEEVTKIINWRGYLLLFSPKNIYLASYNSNNDNYDVKTLSNTVGVSKEDADTIVPILNSVYFKSGTKIYKLVPNLYAASDDILNIHQISVGINNILENIVNTNTETHNFGYSDSDTYMVFIPIESLNKTYCIVNTFDKNLWTLYEYPIYLENINVFSLNKVYLYANAALYYFRESLDRLLQLGLAEYCQDVDNETSQYDINIIKNAVPYTDYLNSIPKDLVTAVLDNVVTSDSFVETFKNLSTPIKFEIDFGQKSSNYTLDKQYLESKLILATLSSKEAIPLSLDIYTDGVSRELHWDANTDGAIWRTSLDSMGILNTGFGINGQDYNGILRQLIVKYSGRGKSIRHVISGESKSLFKFYSMDVRGRILPKKG